MNETIKIVRFHFTEPFHIGELSEGIRKTARYFIHSDTLWGGLVANWINIYGNLDLLKGYWDGSPPFRVSSIFPVIGDKYYIIKPLTLPKKSIAVEYKEYQLEKEYKKVQLIPLNLLSEYLNDRVSKNQVIQEWKEIKNKIEYVVEPKVRLGPTSAASVIYYVSRVKTAKDLDFYFLIQVNELKFYEILSPVLKLLSETGLGGHRSKGNGRFELHNEDRIFMDYDSVSKYSSFSEDYGYILISLLSPKEDNINEILKDSTFQLIERGGWALDSIKKEQAFEKRVFMVKEGSILRKKLFGHLPDVTPRNWNLKITRYGLGMYLPFVEEE